jgi:hypothetical protein
VAAVAEVVADGLVEEHLARVRVRLRLRARVMFRVRVRGRVRWPR